MKLILRYILLTWAVIGATTILLPLPDELQFFENSPNWLRWWLPILILLAWLVVEQRRYLLSWNGLKSVLGIGVSWELTNWNYLCINGTSNPSDTRITGFQFRGFNNTQNTMGTVKATLLFSNGEEIPLKVTTLDGSMDHAENVNVAPKTRIHIIGRFSGVKPDDFIATYAPLYLKFNWDKGEEKLKLSKKATKKQINQSQMKPEPDKF